MPYSERLGWESYWLIDPLDGTKEFIKRNGEFTVNIALIEKQQSVLGVVHVPVTGVTYYGTPGMGAWRQDNHQQPVQIHTRATPRDQRVVVGSRSHASPRVSQFLDNLGPHSLTNMGSSLKFCVIAEGGADLYPRLGPPPRPLSTP